MTDDDIRPHGSDWTVPPVPRPDPLRENRVANIGLPIEMLRSLLDLPDGYRVERIWVEHDPQMIHILVSSPSLAVQPWNTYSPPLVGHLQTQVYIHDDKPWYRWSWSPEQPMLLDILANTLHKEALRKILEVDPMPRAGSTVLDVTEWAEALDRCQQIAREALDG